MSANRRRPSVIRREELVDNARKIIATQGMEKLTIKHLAQTVGITEGAIYRHFESKDDILFELIEDIDVTLQQICKKAEVTGNSQLENLENLLREHLSSVERRRGVSFLVISEVLRNDNLRMKRKMQKVIDSYLSHVETIVSNGIDAGEMNEKIDKSAAAIAFFGLIQATVTLWHFTTAELPISGRYQSLWDVMKEGIAANKKLAISDGS